MPRLEAPRLADVIARDLEQRVLEGSYRPGDRLPAERELAATLGVSRSSLREAIQKLVTRGLLQSRQGGGTYVTDRLEAGFSEPWEEMLQSHPAVGEDLLEFRHMLEASAAAWAAQRATEADRERLRRSFAAMVKAFDGDDLEQKVEQDLGFHMAIAEASHNVVVGHLTASLLRVMRDQLRRNLAELTRVPEHGAQIMAQHGAILEAIEAGAPDRAKESAATHIGFVRERLAETLRAQSRSERALRRLG